MPKAPVRTRANGYVMRNGIPVPGSALRRGVTCESCQQKVGRRTRCRRCDAMVCGTCLHIVHHHLA